MRLVFYSTNALLLGGYYSVLHVNVVNSERGAIGLSIP